MCRLVRNLIRARARFIALADGHVCRYRRPFHRLDGTTWWWNPKLCRYRHNLGYTFRPRSSKNRNGKLFVSFSPAMSNDTGKAIRQHIRRWRLNGRSDKSLLDLARSINAVVRGWINYYGHRRSRMYPTLWHIDTYLVRWAMRKYKRLNRSRGNTNV